MKYVVVIILVFISCFMLSQGTYAADGCYSNSTGRFYYISIGANNWSGSTYATASGTATCSTFTGGSYTGGNCLIEGTSSTNYRNATTDLIYPCPIDDYIPFFVIAFSALGFVSLKKRITFHLS